MEIYLLPPSPREWLEEDHPAYFVLDVVDELDLSAIEARYQEKDRRGTRPYSPQLMTTLLLYGYCMGISSSRRLERATYEDVAVRVIVGDNHPDHTRISEFRRVHLRELSALFVQVLALCQKAGLVKLGHVSLDGTKVKANASKHKAMSWSRMLKSEGELVAEVEELLAQAEAVDQQEDSRHGKGNRGDELPSELRRRSDRLRRIREAKRALEAEASASRARDLAKQERRSREKAAVEEDEAERSRHARRADRAKAKKEAAQEKAQAKAREAGHEEADLAVGDPQELPRHQVPSDEEGNPKSKAQRNFTDPESRIMKRDGAFLQGYNAQAIAEEKSQVIVAAEVTNQAPDTEHLRPMLEELRRNCGALPARLSADAGYWWEDNAAYCTAEGVDAYIATGRFHHGEPPPAVRGRPPKDLDAKGRMGRKLRTKKGRRIYARRKAIIEPVFGQMGQHLQGGFLLRGLEKVRGEWTLHCMAHNLLKLFRAQLAPT